MSGRLPDHYLRRLRSAFHRERYWRVCVDCGHAWETAEIALVNDDKWKGAHVTMCPYVDCTGYTTSIGYVKNMVPPERLATGGSGSPGGMRAFSLGGAYRRRVCQTCKRKWSTGEFLADGTTNYVSECPCCGGVGKIDRKKGRRETKREAKWVRPVTERKDEKQAAIRRKVADAKGQDADWG